MADGTLQSMIANRINAQRQARLRQYYLDQGYSPEIAAEKAAVEMANRDREARINSYSGDSPSESIAVRTANDVLSQRREMNDRDMGEENRQRIQNIYRSNPALLGLDQPPVPLAGLPGYDPTRTEGGVPNRYDTVYREVQTGSGEPVVRFSGPTTEDEIISRRGPQPNIYQRMYGGVKDLLNPLPAASLQGSRQPPTYSTPSYPAPSENGSAATNRLVDRAFSAVSGNSPAQAAVPAPVVAQPTNIGGNYNDVFNVPYNPQGGDYNDVFNVPYTPPAKTADPARKAGPAAAPQQTTTQQASASAVTPETVTLRDLWTAANRPDASATDFFRADRAMQEAIKKGQDVGYYGQAEGKKAGGSVGEKPQKDAAIHKALEIIHHLLTRG
jgi:hypothetical protein